MIRCFFYLELRIITIIIEEWSDQGGIIMLDAALLGFGIGAIIMGPGILLIHHFKPESMKRPELAKKMGMIMTAIGVIFLIIFFA